MYDYHKLYQKNFKNLPKISFWATFIGVFVVVIAGAILLAKLADMVFVAFLVLVHGSALAVCLARFARWLCAVNISQKVVVADTLLAMKSGNAGTPDTANSVKAAPLAKVAPKPEKTKLPDGQKRCWACETVQSAVRDFCIQCNEKL